MLTLRALTRGLTANTFMKFVKNSEETLYANIIGADAVCYQSIDGLVRATSHTRDQLCLACITGKYPTPLAQKMADKMKKKLLNGYEEKARIYETCETLPQA